MAITVLLVDDQPIYRGALRAHLDRSADVKVVAEAADGETAVRLASELHPDVVVMDLWLPDLDGLEATRRIKRERAGTGVVALSGFADDAETRDQCLLAGASDLLDKAAIEALLPAIVSAAPPR